MEKIREDCLNILDKIEITEDFMFVFFFSSHTRDLLCLGIDPGISEYCI